MLSSSDSMNGSLSGVSIATGARKSESRQVLECGPAGVWAPPDSDLAKGPIGKWDPEISEELLPQGQTNSVGPSPSDITAADLEWQLASLPGAWVPDKSF